MTTAAPKTKAKPRSRKKSAVKKTADLKIEYVDPYTLEPHPQNAKQHPDKQIDLIVTSMNNTNGSVSPIVVDENLTILAGHGRWMAHKKRGDASVPVVMRAGLTEAQKKKFLLADNQLNVMTGNDTDKLFEALQDLKSEDVDISDLGFSTAELDKLLNYDPTETEDLLEDAPVKAYGTVVISDDMLLPPEQYSPGLGLPLLLANRIPPIDSEYTVWMNRHRTQDLGHDFLHMFGRESTVGLDPVKTVIGFYIDDKRFERVWSKRGEHAQRFLNAGIKALIMPDFTRVVNRPFPENLWNIYRSFYLARMWQEVGLQVIPNLVDFGVETVEACCEPIPVNAESVAVQIQTVGGRSMKSGGMGTDAVGEDEMQDCLNAALEIVKPKSVLVYGGKPGLRLGEALCKKHDIRSVLVENRASAATRVFNENED